MSKTPSARDDLENFQTLTIGLATGQSVEYPQWEEARNALLSHTELAGLLPPWVISNRWGSQFWQFIKAKAPTYAERRAFIWAELAPLFDLLERGAVQPSALSLEPLIQRCSSDAITAAWRRIQARRHTDPEGAITAARTLLESTCKFILGKLGVEYADSDDLPALYAKTAQAMNLSPQNHNEQVFKQILGGCFTVANGLASLRNTLGDAHGKGENHPKPEPRHADLAINLAGSLSAFLIATYEERHGSL